MFYNKIRQADYRCDGYLDGLEVVCYDYKELAETYRVLPGVVFLVDPPYMGTDISTYRMDWEAGGLPGCPAGTERTPVRLFHLLQIPHTGFLQMDGGTSRNRQSFQGAGQSSITARMNYNSSYTDIMLYKDLPEAA